MRPSKIFLATLLFFGLWTGGTQFMSSMWTNHDVHSNTSLTMRDDYREMQNAVNGNKNSLRSKISTLTTDKGGLLDAASAGLLLVPQFINVIAAPFTALGGAVNAVAGAFSVYLPGWAVTLVKLVIYSTIGFGIFSIALGVRS